MAEDIFKSINIHFGMKRKGEIVFTGETVSNPEKIKIKVWVNGKECDFERKEFGNRISGTIKVDHCQNYHVKITASDDQGTINRFSKTLKAPKESGMPVYYIDEVRFSDDGSATIVGWALDYSSVSVKLYTNSGEEIKAEKFERNDLLNIFPEIDDINAGFLIKLTNSQAKDFPWRLIFEGGNGHRAERDFTKRTYTKESWKDSGGIKRKIARSYETFHEEGFKALCLRIGHYIKTRGLSSMVYQKWIEGLEPSEEELEKQRAEYRGQDNSKLELYSIVVAVYKPKQKDLEALIDSVKAQTYEKWELILADAAGDSFAELAAGDDRIKYFSLGSNEGISANTNEAIKKATGDWILFADHDDTLAPDALYQIHRRILENPDAGFIYSDEDKISADGRKRFEPVFKTDYNPDLLCSENYISHLSAVKRTVMDEAGLLDPAYDGAQDYDFTLRCVERLRDDQIIHIPEVLYHWRTSSASTAADQENKLYAFEAGKRAVQAHLDRIGIPAEVTEMLRHGRYRVHYHWDSTPLVSVIIPNKDHIDDLSRCLDSIRNKTDYPSYEIIIVENNSTEKATFEYYKSLESDKRIKVVKYEGGFNFSAINNYGSSFANGDFFLLLNNDTEVINSGWMSEMVGICMRKDVGIVGAKLYYPDGTIQHAGAIIGIGGVAGHAFKYFPHAHPGTADRLLLCQDYSAVTAACMMVKKDAFEKVNGLSEELAVAFNDIDFCLKVGKAGYRIVFTPFAELTHYESKSRGLEETAEQQDRFRNEVETFLDKWGDFVRKGDPYYNKHYSLKREDFSFNEELTHE